MPNIASALKSEITRLAKREIRTETAALKKATAAQRRHIAELKRQLADLQRTAAQLAKRSQAAQRAPAPTGPNDSPRFHARGLRSLRKRLGLSQADMAKLFGVSELSVYNWEGGKAVPRRESLAAIVALRGGWEARSASAFGTAGEVEGLVPHGRRQRKIDHRTSSGTSRRVGAPGAREGIAAHRGRSDRGARLRGVHRDAAFSVRGCHRRAWL